MFTKEQLIYHLKNESRVLQNPLVEKAFIKVDRADFVGDDYKVEAYEDYPLPIGFNQTISQPTTVAFMFELLDLKEGQRVLDIGSGSGWTSTMLAEMVGSGGFVTAVEVIEELVSLGKENAGKYKFSNLRFEKARQEVGWPGQKFDRILVSASAEKLPQELIGDLNDGGVLVLPIKDAIWRLEKNTGGEIISKQFPGFSFVPLL